MRGLWQGQKISSLEEAKRFHLGDSRTIYQRAYWEPLHWIRNFGQLSKDFADKNSSLRRCLREKFSLKSAELQREVEEAAQDIAQFLDEDALNLKIRRELGGERLKDFHRVDFEQELFEGWAPLGMILHVTPGNSLALPFLAYVEALLAGNLSVVKCPTSSFDLMEVIFDHLETSQGDFAKQIQSFTIILDLDVHERPFLEALYPEMDGVSAWGSESTLETLFKKISPHTRWIPWGHKISFQFVAKERANDPELFDKIVRDVCLVDQAACSSPQILYVEDQNPGKLLDWSKKLALRFEDLLAEYPRRGASDSESAEVERSRALFEAHCAFLRAEGRPSGSVIQNEAIRLWVDPESAPQVSPLFRNLWVKPLNVKCIETTLSPLRRYLQTVGLACDRKRFAELSALFIKAGADRIRPLGSMHDSYPGEPHDGVYATTRFMRRVSLHGDESLRGYYTLNELADYHRSPKSAPFENIVKKDDWNEGVFLEKHAELYFKSGGSSGKAKLSIFSYDDYHLLMRQASKGLMAAGLEPSSDHSMNLFYGGALYGGFISFFTILEQLKAKQFPMLAYEDLGLVAQSIVEHKVDVLLGMPSYLLRLFQEQEAVLKAYRRIRKIFYGGEAMNARQRAYLKDEFGVELIKSATYGSVDLGPLGYQCPFTDDGLHHLHRDVLDLKIFHQDRLEEVKEGETGRLIFRSKVRTDFTRPYEIGDLGRWKVGTGAQCPCGRSDPLFELLGRIGDVFRAGGSYLNYQKFLSVLKEDCGYDGELQIEIQKKALLDHLILKIEPRDSGQMASAWSLLNEAYPDFRELILGKVLSAEIVHLEKSKFLRTPQSGKLRHIIDRRNDA